jgi:hypothetical protein
MEDEELVRGVDRGQQLEVEPDLAEVLMADLLFLVLVQVYLVAVPKQGEHMAFGGHIRDQRCGGRIGVDDGADGSANSADNEPRERIPVPPCLLGSRIQEQRSQDIVRDLETLEDLARQLVVGQYITAVVHDVGGAQRPRPHCQHQEFVGHLSGASPLGPRTWRWRGQAVQVVGLGRRQFERGGECVEYLRRRMSFPPLLKPGVLVGTDGGPRGYLFAA